MSYTDIQSYVKKKYGVSVRTCWIAHVKASHGLTRWKAHNRKGPNRANPCPDKHWGKIEDAFKHFNMI